MKTRIIVDSTSDLLPAIKEQVHIVPLTVRFGDEEAHRVSDEEIALAVERVLALEKYRK